MDFSSYQLISNNTSSLNSGSYLNQTENLLFVKGNISDIWYGFSSNDVIELGVWDRNRNLLNWETINQFNNYNQVTLSYLNTLSFPVTYSYTELNPDFIMYKNEKILLNPSQELTSSFNIQSGSYFLTYNFIREMAGTVNTPLIIKEISPSRKELKIVPIGEFNNSYTAFCNKKILLRDVSPLYIQSVKNCPYGQIYNEISSLYQSQINTIQSLFFLNSDGAIINFLRNLYEDIYIYTTTPLKGTSVDTQNITGSAIRIQGIQTYFNNYLISNSDIIINFSDIDDQFKGYVSASIERKFSPIGPNPSKPYIDAKAFVYDFFIKYFYNPISSTLSSTYIEKYYSPLKNSLNLGNNRLLPIINNGQIDERINPFDPLTLLIKLQSELPNDIMAQSYCWISNVSLIPYIVNSIIKNPGGKVTYNIGPPNFSTPIANASLSNTNLSYTSNDLNQSNEVNRELIISKNISKLSVDYTNFNNFIVFSSAELRLKIFKNKITNISTLSSSLQLLNNENLNQLLVTGTSYPYYIQESSDIQNKIDSIINSFDGYESFLYRSGDYTLVNGSFISSSYVIEMDNSASYYDKYNKDSLINNCPEHILINSDNDDYIIFLSMIGHFFDEIYIYISNIPSDKKIGNNANEQFTRKIVDYMLETFGWNLDDSLEQSTLINNYLNSNQQVNLNKLSSEERLKIIRNRLLINLPEIYKTKGTEEAVKIILACYGIPSSLLSIREYGGINYSETKATYTTYERTYMRQWNTSSIYDTYYLQCPSGVKSFLFKFSIDDSTPYSYGNEQILFGKTEGSSVQEISGSGEWALGFIREPKQNTGKIFFRIGYKGYETFKMYSPQFPLFDGNIYSVILRRDDPDPGFEFTNIPDMVPANYDLIVQRNEFGNQILRLTSSKICYDTASTIRFDTGGWMNLIGWFSYHNGQGYTGTFDKFQVWNQPLSDSNFEDYVNNINSYSYNGSSLPYKSLLFRMHTDYPFDQRLISPSGSGFYLGVISNTNWIGLFPNANPYYTIGSIHKLGSNVDNLICWGAWSGSQKLVYDSSSCNYISESCYPYQFKVIDYPSTWTISKYGPNKFRNEKVNYISQSIEARFDNNGRSTNVNSTNTSPDSNQIGFFVDPQDFKNKDIIRYFGNFNFMDVIGDPSNQFSSSYTSLNNYRNEYKIGLNQLSGSRTLFNELCILYKLYFNRSIFEAIKNVVPARANTLIGLLIEPTILERPKYQSKPIIGENNSGSVLYFDITASHYYKDSNTKLINITTSLDLGTNLINLDFSNISNPTRNYPTNYGGNYISDTPDKFELGHYAGGILTNEELESLILLPIPNFQLNQTTGNAPLLINITNLSVNTTNYSWNFGDGSSISTNIVPPPHIYNYAGTYSITLNTTNGTFSSFKIKDVIVTKPTVIANFTTSSISTGDAPFEVFFINTSVGGITYLWNFGDSYVSTDMNSIHTYNSPGIYTVTLTIYNGVYSDTKTITNYISASIPI